jgi:hypothetical protein
MRVRLLDEKSKKKIKDNLTTINFNNNKLITHIEKNKLEAINFHQIKEIKDTIRVRKNIVN